MTMFDAATAKAELDAFKRHPIAELISRMGYTPTASEASLGMNAKAWKRNPGDPFSIKIYPGSNGFWRWANFAEKTQGTIVDLALEECGGNMAKARQLLREITGTSVPTPSKSSPVSAPVLPSPVPDQSAAPAAIEKLTEPEVRSYYERRSINWTPAMAVPDYLKSRGIHHIPALFADTFRVVTEGSDRQPVGTIKIPAYSISKSGVSELLGMESRKPDGEKYFLKGSSAGVFIAGMSATSGVAVVCESAIECMSHYLLMPREAGYVYIAVRSGAEEHVVNLVKSLRESGAINTVLIATNNDAAGAGYAAKIMAGIAKLKAIDENLATETRMRMPPGIAIDWNEALIDAASRGQVDTGAHELVHEEIRRRWNAPTPFDMLEPTMIPIS